MTRPVILVAASGLAREAVHALRAAGGGEVLGFVDDDPSRYGQELGGVRVLGPVESVAQHPEAQVVLCAGRGTSRLALAARLAALGLGPERYATVIHPAAVVPDGVRIGAGSIVLAGVVFTSPVEVGEHVVIMPNAVITHDDRLEPAATLCAGVLLGGNVGVGGAAYLGMGCAVREGCRVGERAVLGMGAVAIRDVPAGEVWVGSPARFLRAAQPVAVPPVGVAG